MITRRQRLVVGVFVVSTSAILAGFLGVLWGIKASRPVKRYLVVTESSVSGLTPSAAVKYLGVDAGRVDKMEFDQSTPPKVKLTLALNVDTPVKLDTKAQLTAVGITGLQIIELVRGKSPVDLPEGSELEFRQSQLQDIFAKFDRLSGSVEIFFGENKERIAATIEHANKFLETSTSAVASTGRSIEQVSRQVELLLEENRASVRQVLDRTRATLDDVAALTGEARSRQAIGQLLDTVADVRSAVSSVDLVLRDVRTQLAPNVVGEAVADVRSLVRSAEQAATAAKDLVTQVGGSVEDDLLATNRVLGQLEQAARDLVQLVREVKERPALLFRDLERPRRQVVDK